MIHLFDDGVVVFFGGLIDFELKGAVIDLSVLLLIVRFNNSLIFRLDSFDVVFFIDEGIKSFVVLV